MPKDGDPTRDSTAPVYIDVRSVRNPATKGRNVRYRVAASTGWIVTFGVLWDKTIVNRQQMEAVAIDAGRLVGIGDGRSVGMGRFSVENFEVQDA
jgi:CRISPR/Cas system endoribonuclease Cas6 (RAMP superfamily)